MRYMISGGRVLDPSSNTDEILDVIIRDGIIEKVGKNLKESEDGKNVEEVLDAAGLCVAPGLIDLHVHLREPGFEYKETVETGTRAMAHGGYTGVCPMPNTKPATDSPERIQWLIQKAKEVSPIHVFPVGAVTQGQMGEKESDIAGMKMAGAFAISEDGKSVMNSAVYRRAMEQAREAGLVVMAHCEDINLVDGGCINKGAKSEELGVRGISNAVEDIITARDILLAKETGARLHLCHCSTKDSVKMVREAKADGVKVSAEVCPHHFTLCDEDIKDVSDANYKMNPPLRSKEDREAMIEGLVSGVIDCISTDHAPHSEEEKSRDITKAPFGITGSETALCLSVTYLVRTGKLSLLALMEKMSYNPARVLQIEDRKGQIREGWDADIVIFDPDEKYTIRREDMLSKGKNTPYIGWEVYGKVKYTICDGKIVYREQ